MSWNREEFTMLLEEYQKWPNLYKNYQQAIQLSETPVFCNTQHIFGISLSIFSSAFSAFLR
ncbi:unnamed protein product [Acanthoscelides obtectus]|uniref:Uncharacterized protein n=1 Tax=Acanthoscelides obtectus TaxID=200917 RepID=A0A9P0NSB4_ACAOB|nr:unnamed protein product [Acanthoscelides obtectus]CAK1673761.1 hypothetical protein AOBTE_LOCUS29430 [Acanthoscelides obtectus]